MARAQSSASHVIAFGLFGGLPLGERLCVHICERTATIDVRVWRASDAGMRPTDHGLRLPLSALPWFSDAIAGAFDFARGHGLLQSYYGELPK